MLIIVISFTSAEESVRNSMGAHIHKFQCQNEESSDSMMIFALIIINNGIVWSVLIRLRLRHIKTNIMKEKHIQLNINIPFWASKSMQKANTTHLVCVSVCCAIQSIRFWHLHFNLQFAWRVILFYSFYVVVLIQSSTAVAAAVVVIILAILLCKF